MGIMAHLKMAAEEKQIRAVLQRDFSASRMNATKWREAVETLSKLPLQYRIKFVDVDHPLDGGVLVATKKHFDSRWGPVLILSVEWLEIDALERISDGLLLKPKQIDHTQEVQQRLNAIGVPYTQAGALIRIIGHVRNSDVA